MCKHRHKCIILYPKCQKCDIAEIECVGEDYFIFPWWMQIKLFYISIDEIEREGERKKKKVWLMQMNYVVLSKKYSPGRKDAQASWIKHLFLENCPMLLLRPVELEQYHSVAEVLVVLFWWMSSVYLWGLFKVDIWNAHSALLSAALFLCKKYAVPFTCALNSVTTN